MQLYCLARGDVGQIAAVGAGELSNGPQLPAGPATARNANSHHEVLGCLSLAARAARNPRAVALGINSPPLEVERGPLRQHARTPFARKLPHFIECSPRVLLALQPFGLLRLGLLCDRRRAVERWGLIAHLGLLFMKGIETIAEPKRAKPRLRVCAGAEWVSPLAFYDQA